MDRPIRLSESVNLNLAEVYKLYADANGISVDEMDEFDRKMAIDEYTEKWHQVIDGSRVNQKKRRRNDDEWN